MGTRFLLMALTLLLAGAPAFAGKDVFERLGLEEFTKAAPDFALVSRDGRSRRLKDWFGKPIVLHFWASWCTSCRKELPQLAALSSELRGGGAVFLPVSVDGADKQAEDRKLLASIRPSVPDWRVKDPEEGHEYWAWGLPMTYFIGADGKVVARAMGARDWASVPHADLLTLLARMGAGESVASARSGDQNR